VPADSWTISAHGVGVPAELPVGYTRCADEGATCTVPGTRTVAYGIGRYTYLGCRRYCLWQWNFRR
jgi:hypothetical protein